jgi:DNA-binding PadR family transcriptional regulator
MMERSGPIHGYLVSERIATRTEGAWRPGPGAVYPSLQKLVERGLAKRKRKGNRQEYSITPKGKALLAKIRARNSMVRQARLDLAPLMAEVMGNEDVGVFMLLRLRRAIDSLESYLARTSKGPGSDRNLRNDAMNELSRSVERLRRGLP